MVVYFKWTFKKIKQIYPSGIVWMVKSDVIYQNNVCEFAKTVCKPVETLCK